MNIDKERCDNKAELHAVGIQQAAEIQGSKTRHMPFSGPQDIMWAFGPSDADPGTLEWKPMGCTMINDSIEWDNPQG